MDAEYRKFQQAVGQQRGPRPGAVRPPPPRGPRPGAVREPPPRGPPARFGANPTRLGPPRPGGMVIGTPGGISYPQGQRPKRAASPRGEINPNFTNPLYDLSPN